VYIRPNVYYQQLFLKLKDVVALMYEPPRMNKLSGTTMHYIILNSRICILFCDPQ